MRRRRASRFVLVAAAATALAVPAAAQGTVRIGSNLARPALYGFITSPTTFSIQSLPTASQASGGIVSPVNGTVVLWRVRAGDIVGPVAFRVIRPLGAGLFTGAGTSATVTPATNGATLFGTQLPIAAGDLIGLDCCQDPGGKYMVNGAGTMRIWSSPLVDGAPGRAPTTDMNPRELAINADIEPTSAFALGAITRNQKKGTATLTATVPNPGELTWSGKGVKVAGAAGAVISKAVTAPGEVKLTIRAKGKKKKKLNETGKVKVKPKITYTPTGGEPSSQTIKVKLKKR